MIIQNPFALITEIITIITVLCKFAKWIHDNHRFKKNPDDTERAVNDHGSFLCNTALRCSSAGSAAPARKIVLHTPEFPGKRRHGRKEPNNGSYQKKDQEERHEWRRHR